MIARRYNTPTGLLVQVAYVGERSYLAIFDVEVLDASGEVVEYHEGLSRYAVDALAVRKGWSPCRAS